MIKKVFKRVFHFLPLKRIVLFESCPDLSDNTKPIFDEMIKRGYNKKYRFVWLCFDRHKQELPKIHNVSFLYANKHRFKTLLLNHTAKVIICCNRFLGCDRKKQSSFYLMHGTPIKNTSNYYCVPHYINWMITSGTGVNVLCSKYFNFPLERCVPLGYARNDVLYNDGINLANCFGKYKKYVVWYPTVKQFKNGFKTNSVKPIPFVDDLKNVNKLSKALIKNDTLLIIKPHFAQITDDIKNYNASNIVFINDEFFTKHRIKSYELVGSCDALITDYSSIYYDFTICDKPICLIWDDIHEYMENPGLVDNYQKLLIGGEKVYSLEGLIDFLQRVADGVDLLKRERNALKDSFNFKASDSATNRVVDFIIDKSNL